MAQKTDDTRNRKKTVLILAYDFPPYASVGAQRPYSWFRYLNEFDIDPVIVTRQWSRKHGNYLDYIDGGDCQHTVASRDKNGTLIQCCYKPTLANRLLLKYGKKRFRFIRLLLSAYYEIIQWYFPAGPKYEIYRTAREWLRTNKADLIIATADPFILFRYGAKLSRKSGVPWAADYRDVWIFENVSGFLNRLRRNWERRLERRYVRSASFLTSVSEFTLQKIKQNRLSQKGFVLLNGYDTDTLEKASHITQHTGNLNIACIGTIYNYYPFFELLDTLKEYMNENPEERIVFNLYGLSFESFWQEQKFTTQYSGLSFIRKSPRIPQSELLVELGGNNLVLLFNNYSFLGTKIYDFIALKRKILFCFTDDKGAQSLREQYFPLSEDIPEALDTQQKMITETNAGTLVRDRAHLKDVLKELYLEFTRTRRIDCNSANIEQFSRRLQTKSLAEIIHNFLKKESNPPPH